MNFSLLKKLVSESKLNKFQIAESAGISRTTLDNALNGADIKISTIENLARVLEVNTCVFFETEPQVDAERMNKYEIEIKRLQTLLDNMQQKSTKVVVELDVTQDEFIKMGLKDKVIQILNR